ncbi:hypothetical protein [Methylobacterium soli]|uniref:HEPN domain-containing protein n=1 Tax=Methylobacterium soli TaxID=553447 RepID=A0A6L3SZX2_9HYPH|nr:hypothetical protein [Methylobacterium soli]KAB1077773.1 hypothetical protein F6X53_17595 [Methylobacterium soli]GJE42899.1 hypothetical protein AEGHOMDF_2073 [Methylobacterium soli]
MSDPEAIEMPRPQGLFAGELYARGVEYLEAFEHLSEAKPDLKFAGYFLLTHSIELLLKSFLASQGVAEKIIRGKLGHDLPWVLSECESRRLPAVENLAAFVLHLHEMSNKQDLRYPTSYRLSVPRPADCLPVAHALRSAIALIVETGRNRALLQFASSTRHLGDKKVRWAD